MAFDRDLARCYRAMFAAYGIGADNLPVEAKTQERYSALIWAIGVQTQATSEKVAWWREE